MSDIDGCGLLPLPLVDGRDLEAPRRQALRPGEPFADRSGHPYLLPRYFYEVDSWQTALHTEVAEHFTLAELMGVDVRESAAVRKFPRHVPCTITLLAAHLELFRKAVGTFVYVAANGGYRSPAHGLVDHASTHCWGTAANVFKIGDEYLDEPERIERFAKIAARVVPGFWIRPFGQDKGYLDDHLHLDIGYVRLTPRGRDDAVV